MLNNKSFKVVVLGCRSNQYEAEALISQMLAHRAHLSEDSPEIIIIVTCSITSRADVKVRKLIRHMRKKHLGAFIVVTGCYAQTASPETVQDMGVDLLVGNRLKNKIPELIANHIENRSFYVERVNLLGNNTWDELSLDSTHSRTRAFIKVQDGCNHGCSYCIVPMLRGAPVSRNVDDILEEIVRVTEKGCSEIVLTGIHIGLYNYKGLGLPGLIDAITLSKRVKRLRFGSIEPLALTDTLLSSLASSGVFCPHLHIPVQSGDDSVLLSMKRGYTSDQFERIVGRVREYLGQNVHISTDLIVGYPTETEEMFLKSLDLMTSLRFGKVHVFPYSRREGTEAASLPVIPESVLKGRVERALALAEILLDEYAATCVGNPTTMLVEKRTPRFIEGWTQEYVRAQVSSNGLIQIGEEVVFSPKRSEHGLLFGDIIPL